MMVTRRWLWRMFRSVSFSAPRAALVALTAVAAACGFAPTVASAQVTVEEHLWGFDRKVSPHEFNPLSILLNNPTGQSLEVHVTLRRTINNTSPVGAPHQVSDVVLAPFSQRWVQFYVYPCEDYDTWELSWGPRGGRMNLPTPEWGEPGVAFLVSADSLQRPSQKFRTFPEEVFPPGVAATAGLREAILDHVPRWEPLRREAFLDWLRGGGILHLLHEPSGRYPEFPAAMDELNAPFDRFAVGDGAVIRHPVQRENFTDAVRAAAVSRLARRPPQFEQIEDADGLASFRPTWEGDAAVFSNLGEMTRADHNWGLILLMAIVYLLAVFPGTWLLSLKRFEMRIPLVGTLPAHAFVYLALVGLIVLFSAGFQAVGRRGYGEETTTHTVAIARPLDDGHCDVRQWVNVFVTRGRKYPIQHGGAGRLYSTGESYERVNGLISNMLNGTFLVDIPPYSNRTFVLRSKVAVTPPQISAGAWTPAEEGQLPIGLSISGNFPKNFQAVALHGKRIYHLRRNGGTLVSTTGGLISDEIGADLLRQAQYQSAYWYDSAKRDPQQRYETLFLPLIARQLHFRDVEQAARLVLPENLVRVYVYTDISSEFHTHVAEGPGFDRQAGKVLYVQDFWRSDNP